jgi:hypothetical protein
LLVAFVGLGLSPLAWRTAVKSAALLTAFVIVAVFVKNGAV